MYCSDDGEAFELYGGVIVLGWSEAEGSTLDDVRFVRAVSLEEDEAESMEAGGICEERCGQ